MAVISLKPHKIQLLKAGAPYRNDNGDWITKGEELIGEERCDVVSSGKAIERKFEDGETKTYSYTIYLDKDCLDYNIGDHVRIILSTGEVHDLKVLGFVKYQLQAKLWV